MVNGPEGEGYTYDVTKKKIAAKWKPEGVCAFSMHFLFLFFNPLTLKFSCQNLLPCNCLEDALSRGAIVEVAGLPFALFFFRFEDECRHSIW